MIHDSEWNIQQYGLLTLGPLFDLRYGRIRDRRIASHMPILLSRTVVKPIIHYVLGSTVC
jgi:hypothetical protein